MSDALFENTNGFKKGQARRPFHFRGHTPSDKTSKKISKAKKGDNNTMLERNHYDETKKKRIIQCINKISPPLPPLKEKIVLTLLKSVKILD